MSITPLSWHRTYLIAALHSLCSCAVVQWWPLKLRNYPIRNVDHTFMEIKCVQVPLDIASWRAIVPAKISKDDQSKFRSMSGLDAYERPPEDLKAIFKHYQGISHEAVDKDLSIVQGKNSFVSEGPWKVIRHIDLSEVHMDAVDQFHVDQGAAPVLEWPDLPGLHFIPGFLSEAVQLQLLSRMLHRDLANPEHQTNIHKHFKIPYEIAEADRSECTASFFNESADSCVMFEPLEPTVHNPLTVSQFLNKKLRWLTLGGQYDWTEKIYPDGKPPEFPSDIANLIQKGFPDMTPQAAIINVYSPGDTLALHRDVSEISDNGLVSVSVGSEAIFIAGLPKNAGPSKWRAFLLRSGDAIYMSGASRYAWHGVPKIFKNTCPEGIRAWPGDPNTDRYRNWRNWMQGKRINLNVRQMYDQQ